jgi:hypothetical protein
MRAALSIGLLWGVAWAVCGAALEAWRVLVARPHLADPSRYLGRFMWTVGTVFGVCGLVAGAAFALALSRAERSREVVGLSPRRAAGWGALAGTAAALLTIPIFGTPLPVVAVSAAIVGAVGSISAFGTVSLAQRGIEQRSADRVSV